MLDKDYVYVPDFTNEELVQFSIPFCRLMFGYAKLDREVADVVCAAAGIAADIRKFIRRGSADDFEYEVENSTVRLS